MKLGKIAEAALGFYLLLPGPEDIATAGTTVFPSALVGGALLLHAFGAKLPKL